MENPPGYLFRVGRRRTRRPRTVLSFVPQEHKDPVVEPGLAPALRALSA
ncbi:MAG: hypothetical protein ACLPUG_18600 [Acidimicrobiales bacterium]